MILKQASEPFVASRNSCRLCSPLGASLVFCGIEGGLPLLHGSQGCSTYIRRYMISHYREPVDIASSNFGEAAAIFGGERNLHTALENVLAGYKPKLIGIATTCLSETMGEDVSAMVRGFVKNHPEAGSVPMLHVSTPSYAGSQFEGYWSAVYATIDQLNPVSAGQAEARPVDSTTCETNPTINLISGMLSPADLRHLAELTTAFGLDPLLFPDYADRLDGPIWSEYQRIPPGGTPVGRIAAMRNAAETCEFSELLDTTSSAGDLLRARHGVPCSKLGLPIGVEATDRWLDRLEKLSGRGVPSSIAAERGRLIDSYIDAHKYLFAKRCLLFGEPDLVLAMAGFLGEIGVFPVICATGQSGYNLERKILERLPGEIPAPQVFEGVDFESMAELVDEVELDLMVGNSKGYKLSRARGLPLIRVGFPIHDRIGGARVLHVGYRGAQQLFDRITNTLLEARQDGSEVGYTYL